MNWEKINTFSLGWASVILVARLTEIRFSELSTEKIAYLTMAIMFFGGIGLFFISEAMKRIEEQKKKKAMQVDLEGIE